MGGTARLPWMCVQGDWKALIDGKARRRVVKTTFFAYRDLRDGVEGPWNMRPRARRTIGRLSRGCSRGGDGVTENFTISELGDRSGCQNTITPSWVRYEDQVEVRLPLATLRVVLRNQLLVARRPHADLGLPP